MAAKKVKTKEVSLVRLTPILELLHAAIWTGKVSGEKPISVVLVADQESAKTACLLYFDGTKGLRYISDITSEGVAKYKNEIESGRLRHFVVMDLVRILSHSKGVGERTIQRLASLMEEGESETADPSGVTTWDKLPKVGFLMSCTPDVFDARAGRWRKTGFISRFLPIRFDYCDKTVKEIHRSIALGRGLPLPKPTNLPEFHSHVTIPPRIADLISMRSQAVGKDIGTHGFRFHRAMRCLIKARALSQGRPIANMTDWNKIESWSEFFSTDKAIEL